MTRGARALLEPGALLSGALFRDLVSRGGVSTDALAPGTRLGAFRVVRELGRGGMGVVHLAERDDGEFTQQVALKCLVDRDSAASTELFLRERQILAGLRHPNIARLLDGGRADDGLLWFAMEWVEGERIDAHCARAGLGFEDRLRLWLGVAEAVQFAHARLLIHRDIKPGNVLVDADGQPRLLDFGIAALLGEGEGTRAYSPGHASPEQRAGGEVGTASDQYQLGRLLARMLSADEVSAEHATTSVLRSTLHPDRSDDAPSDAPATGLDIADDVELSATRRRELEAVLARACAQDPAHRYGSVAEFKGDVRRLLARRPVEARRGGWRYALLCAVRRRPRMAAFAATVAVVIVALVAGFNMRLAHERDVARTEAAKVKAINAFVNEDLLAAADPFEGHSPDVTVREALDRARDRLGDRFGDEAAVEAELRATLGWSYAGLSEYAAAITQLERALELRARLEPATAAESVRVRLELAHNLVSASRYAEAEPMLRALIDALAGVPARAVDRAHAQVTLAELLGFVGRSDDALAVYAAVEADLQRLGESHPIVLYRDDARAQLLLSLGRAREALPLFDVLVARSTAALGADTPQTWRLREGRARALRDLGRFDEAIEALRSLHAARVAAFGAEHRETLRNHNELAVALSRSGNREAAIAIWREDLAVRERRFGERHQGTLVARYNLANELAAVGRNREAEQAFRGVLEAERASLGPADPGTLVTQISLAETIGRQGRAREALVLLDDARETGHTTLASRPEASVLALVRSRQLHALGRTGEALAEARTALAGLEGTVGDAHRRTREAREWLATFPAGG
ncbi:protein kinase domain-containing protein [Dokdonella sp. MW10]|uniref:serine/threonine-protein kinase n=1 Tax=Dokdonella sp. MW10 TaxID=2992926 RepID=UPI003F81AC1F